MVATKQPRIHAPCSYHHEIMKYITIKGAREHNLKNINLRLPRNAFIVITGLSGSGKSSLAFDTIYTEGQRRYLESLSSYARQFLEKMKTYSFIKKCDKNVTKLKK